MIEVLLLINILIVLIVYNSKTIISNSSKYKVYKIKEDILTLSNTEKIILKEIEDRVKSDKEMLECVLRYKNDTNVNYKYNLSNNNSSSFNIEHNRMYLKYKDEKRHITLREVEVRFVGSNKEIIFIPKLYKIII